MHPAPSLQSPAPSPRPPAPGVSRGGITLVEILISMGVLTVGLLGVAAMFPVGASLIQQQQVSDRADSIAQAAVSDAVARGLLDPGRWVSVRTNATTLMPTLWPATAIGSAVFDGDFSHQLGQALAREREERAIALQTGDYGYQSALAAEVERSLNARAGSVYFVDPHGVAESMTTQSLGMALPAGSAAGSVALFPASADFSGFAGTHPAWAPWAGFWPVRRVSVATNGPRVANRPVVPTAAEAAELVGAGDDLTVRLNDYRGNPYGFTPDNPSQQTWDRAANGRPLKRLSRDEFTLAMTVVPSTPRARDALAGSAQSHAYDVSAVVYHRRAVGGGRALTADPLGGNDQTILGERLVRAAVATRGVSGGQLLLYNDGGEFAGPQAVESPLENLRDGQWVMLLGPHPDSGSARPLLFCKWYRVLALEQAGGPGGEPAVFLRGPDWPWLPAGDPADPSTAASNDLRMVIVPDVVAVHTRTMKLQAGAAWEVN